MPASFSSFLPSSCSASRSMLFSTTGCAIRPRPRASPAAMHTDEGGTGPTSPRRRSAQARPLRPPNLAPLHPFGRHGRAAARARPPRGPPPPPSCRLIHAPPFSRPPRHRQPLLPAEGLLFYCTPWWRVGCSRGGSSNGDWQEWHISVMAIGIGKQEQELKALDRQQGVILSFPHLCRTNRATSTLTH
uniref:Uncharacterized protein n=1 Tax=Arundo donax TaxID=35708 RepID=A0A0A9TEM5_ARUDO